MLARGHHYVAHLTEVHVGVIVPEHAEDEIVGVGRSFYSCGSSADEDEREQIVAERAPQPFGLFEAVYYGVAYPQGIAQPFKVHGVRLSARSAKESRAAARSEDEVVVGERSHIRADLPGVEVHPPQRLRG